MGRSQHDHHPPTKKLGLHCAALMSHKVAPLLAQLAIGNGYLQKSWKKIITKKLGLH